MEIIENKNERYIRAQKRVEQIKQFYKHLLVYVIINLLVIGRRIYKDIVYRDESVIEAFLDIDNYNLFFWWGIVVVLHGVNVFGRQRIFSKDWEDRKIKEYMNK